MDRTGFSRSGYLAFKKAIYTNTNHLALLGKAELAGFDFIIFTPIFVVLTYNK